MKSNVFTVFGAGGFIGTHLVRRLTAEGEVVIVPPRHGPRPDGPLGHAVYAIGLTADFRARPFDTMDAHVATLTAILRESSFESFTYLSSTRVYQKAARGREDEPLPVAPGDPSDLYNISKLAGEAACLALDDPRVRVARLSNVYGPDMDRANFLASVIADAVAGHLRLGSDPESEKDFVPVDMVARALHRIALQGVERIYNVASGVNVSHGALAEALRALTGCRLSIAPDAPRTSFPRIEIGRLEALMEAAGEDWRPPPLSDRLRMLIADIGHEQFRQTGT